METRKLLTLATLLLALPLIGCTDRGAGSATARQKVYKVTGKVTMSGAAVANAIVTFSPKGEMPAATGRTDTEGKFSLTTYDADDGAAAGDYVALVTKEGSSAASGMPTGHDPKNTTSSGAPPMHSAQKTAGSTGLLPAKYSSATASDLLVTVKPDGTNDVVLELKP